MREEIACLLRWSASTATRALSDLVQDLDDTTASKVQERVLARAAAQTTAEFRCSVRRAIARVDARN